MRADELELSLAKAHEDRDVKTPEIEALHARLSEVEERHSQTLAELETHARQAAEHRSRDELEQLLAREGEALASV